MPEDLKRCLLSIREKSTYRNYEIIIVENNSTEEETFRYYKELEKEDPRIHVVFWEGPFNYSEINNFGAAHAKGEYLLLLNNDTEVISPSWMEEMLGYCMRSDVGIVGARLYYEDNTIQHAGVVLGFGGIAGHCFVQQPRESTGYCHRIICAQNYSAVTAACMMTDRKVFEQAGVDVNSGILTYDYLRRMYIVTTGFVGALEGLIVYYLSYAILKKLRYPIRKPQPLTSYYPSKISGVIALILIFVYAYSVARPFSNPTAQNILQSAGMCGVIYLIFFGFIALIMVCSVYLHLPRAVGVILTLFLTMSISYIPMLAGYLYISRRTP